MVELSRNARVAVRNPSQVVGYSAPRSIEGRILARGPAGPSGGPIPVGGTAGQVVTPDGFGEYVWTTVAAILGLSSDAVGTSDTQTLTNKTLEDPVITAPSGWTSYTPTWTATGGGNSLGDGTLTGRYHKVGRTVTFFLELKFGATTNLGAGNYLFTVPVTARGGINTPLGTGMPYDSSPAAREVAVAYLNSSTDFAILRGTGGLVSATAPYAWAAGDKISVTGTYEAAS